MSINRRSEMTIAQLQEVLESQLRYRAALQKKINDAVEAIIALDEDIGNTGLELRLRGVDI